MDRFQARLTITAAAAAAASAAMIAPASADTKYMIVSDNDPNQWIVYTCPTEVREPSVKWLLQSCKQSDASAGANSIPVDSFQWHVYR